MKLAWIWFGMVVIMVLFIAAMPAIQEWERTHNFPYVRMCNSAFTGWQDTCRK